MTKNDNVVRKKLVKGKDTEQKKGTPTIKKNGHVIRKKSRKGKNIASPSSRKKALRRKPQGKKEHENKEEEEDIDEGTSQQQLSTSSRRGATSSRQGVTKHHTNEETFGYNIQRKHANKDEEEVFGNPTKEKHNKDEVEFANPKKRIKHENNDHDDTLMTMKKKASLDDDDEDGGGGMIMINRAPVLTLWVAVVAKREGFKFEEGLSFGRAIAGLLAQSKGRKLGVYEELSKEEKEEKKRKRKMKEIEKFSVFGMNIPGKVVDVQSGFCLALEVGGKPISPSLVNNYLHKSFGPNYEIAKGEPFPCINVCMCLFG